MKILKSSDYKEVDEKTILESSISSIELMERAASAVVHYVLKKFQSADKKFLIFAGPGNNGGDALAVARILIKQGMPVEAYLFHPEGHLSEDCAANCDRLKELAPEVLHEVTTQFEPPQITDEHIVIDGLFGSGLNRRLTGGFAAVVRYINQSSGTVVSIDIPSGLMGEESVSDESVAVVRADVTCSFQLPKLSFFFPENMQYLGQVEILDISLSPEAIAEVDTAYELVELPNLYGLLRERDYFAHKGNFGKNLLIAGSEGMAGAAILASKACMRSGAGLLMVHTPHCNLTALHAAVPEVVVLPDVNEKVVSTLCPDDDFDAVGIGPGLGLEEDTIVAVLDQITTTRQPMVVDADALNALARHPQFLRRLPKGSILTPHAGELDRLAGTKMDTYARLCKARDLAMTYEVVVVLKGGNSFICCPDGKCLISTAGNPGMATAGSGDVLTGILLSLLGQGYRSDKAALLGVSVHGLAGDMAVRQKGDISLMASDITDCLPEIWKLLERRGK